MKLYAHLLSHNIGQSSFSQAGRATEQKVVEWFSSLFRSLNKDLQVFFMPHLTDKIIEMLRAKNAVKALIFTATIS